MKSALTATPDHRRHHSHMAPPQAWFDEQTAPTTEVLLAGDGCHPDEARALNDYLCESTSAEEAARKTTAPILKETSPPEELYRIWGFLSDGLVKLSTDDRHKMVNLLFHIQSRPPRSDIVWAQLPGFGSMWDSLNRLHLHGTDAWERYVGSFAPEEIDELRQTFATIGHTEAEMILRGVVPADWGYQVLNLTCSGRLGLDVFVSEIFAWLETAGKELRLEKAKSETTVLRFTRPIPNSLRRENMAVEETLAEHWNSWRWLC